MRSWFQVFKTTRKLGLPRGYRNCRTFRITPTQCLCIRPHTLCKREREREEEEEDKSARRSVWRWERRQTHVFPSISGLARVPLSVFTVPLGPRKPVNGGISHNAKCSSDKGPPRTSLYCHFLRPLPPLSRRVSRKPLRLTPDGRSRCFCCSL